MTPAQRASRRVVRQRRFIALACAVVLVFALVLGVRAVACGSSPAGFVGGWAGSDKTLGSTSFTIAKGADGSTYSVSGLQPSGDVVKTLHVGDDGSLSASGSTTQGSWHLDLTLTADGRQLLAQYTAPGGPAPILLRFTRTSQ
jgi:hypothetical protein